MFLSNLLKLGLHKSSCILFSCLFFVSCTTVSSKKMARSSAAVVSQEKCIQALSVVTKLKNKYIATRITRLAAQKGISPLSYVIIHTHGEDFKAKFAALEESSFNSRIYTSVDSLWARLIRSINNGINNEEDFKTKATVLLGYTGPGGHFKFTQRFWDEELSTSDRERFTNLGINVVFE